MEEAERLCDRVAIIDHGRIIDVDSPSALVAKYCRECTVVLSTTNPDAERHLRALPHLATFERADTQCTIRGSSAEIVTEVIHALSAHDIAVTEFRTVLPTLEDVFLKLTGRSLRD
jgi:ABC-2 type transport system ATP-binding protein